jgi:hypothetical protein
MIIIIIIIIIISNKIYFLDLFYLWLYIFRISSFFGDGSFCSFLQVSSES